MARTKITFPDKIHFTTKLSVRVTDLNYGNHMGNDAFVGLMQQARILMLNKFGLSELNVGENTSLIQGDLVVTYHAEGHLNDEIEFNLAIDDISNSSFDIYYQATNLNKNKLLALAKTRMVCFSYEQSKTLPVPESFRMLLND
ncbi:MAG: thioesterase family protein [Bacteroidetes bacterium]|nr:thioesterase family protein [Bacteroidota bacterium]